MIKLVTRTNPSFVIRGQAALIILAVMAIGMTIAMSLSRQVVTEVQISKQEEKSTKAFSAAEAGVEEALRQLEQGQTNVSINPEDLGVTGVDVSVSEQGQSNQFIYPITLRPGETAPIWLRNHNADGSLNLASGYSGSTIKVCWQDEAALEIIYFYLVAPNSYQMRKFALDPNSTRAGDNRFATGSEIGNCSEINGFERGYSVDLTGGTPLLLVLRPLYQLTRVAVVAGSGTLPAQGHLITSSGSITEGSEKISRRIQVFRSWKLVSSSLFQSAFGTGIEGN